MLVRFSSSLTIDTQITVNYNINPSTISQSRIITYTADDPIVSFCTRFNLIDPSNNQVANFVDTPVAVRVDITQNFEILAILADEEDNYGAEAFECDADNNRITEPTFKTQGSRIRLCVQPDSFTRGFGVVMKSINRLKLIRGDVSDDIIIPDGVIKDLIQTEYRCTPGDVTCYLTAEVDNRFFYSRGDVTAEGVAWLQYAFPGSNRRRGLIEIPFQVGVSSEKSQQQQMLAPPLQPQQMWNRQLQVTAGAFIGGRDFSATFEVEPSGTDWEATAFLCDGRNLPLVGEALKRDRNKDDDIRVCVMPTQEARDRGVYVREISSFFFEQGELIQFALQPSAQQANNTLYICNAGEPLCALKIHLSDDFFNKNMDVVGVGEVLLQYGTKPRTSPSRRLQDGSDPTVDAGFAGRTNVLVQFGTDPTYVPPSEQTWQEKADDWWHDTPLFLRIVYVMAAVVGFLILLCFLWAICCGNPFAKKKTVPQDGTKSKRIFIQPVFMRGKNKGDAGADDEKNSMDKGEEPQDRDTSDDWEVDETNTIPASRRLENSQMDAVPEAESAHFATPGTNAFHESFAKIEPDYTKSPKRKSSGRVSTGDAPNSPKRRSSKGGADSVKSPKRTSSVPVGGADSVKSPKRASSKGGGGDSVKSPKRRSSKGGADSVKSPKRRSSVKSGSSQSPKSKRKSSINPGDAGSVTQSPKPRRSTRASMDSVAASTRSVGSVKSPLPRRSTRTSTKSPGGRHASLDDSDRSGARKVPNSAPARTRRSAAGDKSKMPDLPF
jgi:hypothetical protein